MQEITTADRYRQVAEQISSGRIVCPRTHSALRLQGERLLSKDGTTEYPLLSGIPILLADRKATEAYANSSARMNHEYEVAKSTPNPSLLKRLRKSIRRWISPDEDSRTEAAREARRLLFTNDHPGAIYISVGGGPIRQDPRLLNLNIGPFPNVEIVADAHQLPYASESLEGVLCEAVLEHLSDPSKAVAEMFRVLKRGGRLLAVTPLLQGYHGYPNHFQNYTLTGHELLLTRAGFRTISAGTCAGPMVAWINLTGRLIREFFPAPVAKVGDLAWSVVSAFLRPLDRRFAVRENSHFLADSTFVLAEKP